MNLQVKPVFAACPVFFFHPAAMFPSVERFRPASEGLRPTQLLAEKGYSVMMFDDDGNETTESFYQKDFEKKFFSPNTNNIFCKTFLENAIHDPVTNEIGKTIIFCVRQNHAAKITQILNEMADKMYPGKYQSDFALQVTSLVHDAQQFTINFANNNLRGAVGEDGMKIDRMYFDRFEETVKEDAEIKKMIEQKDMDGIEQYILQHICDKPKDYFNTSQLRDAAKVDRRLSLREIIEKIFGYIPYFKNKNEFLEDEFEKFDSRYLPEDKSFEYARIFLKVTLQILNSEK